MATALNEKEKTGSQTGSQPGYPGYPDDEPDDITAQATNPATDPPGDNDTLSTNPPGVGECPCWRCYLDWWQDGAERKRPGVWYHSVEEDSQGNKSRIDEWVCGPLVLEAVTYDRHGASFGRLLRVRDVRGHWHEWTMPMRMLKGHGEEMRGELYDLGLEIDPNKRGKLTNYLMHKPPKRDVIAALALGWHGDTFVFPDLSIGPDDVRYQCETATVVGFDQAGTLTDWRDRVATLAQGNHGLTLAIATAFAGPLLARVHLESCGLHLYGASSGGKTTALQAAVSVWGSRALLRTWNGTGNGIEAAAAESSDSLLVLDEINQASGHEIGNIVYALANGRGKSRANRTGGARQIACWRTAVLSSGERTLEARMLEVGAQHHAGQDVRLLNVPADGRRYGTFDDIHGRDSARAFADEIKEASTRYHGTAGRAFVRYLIDHATDFGGMLKLLTDQIAVNGGQEARAARQFALIGLAGDLATKAGITGWPPGAAIGVALEAFARWRDARGAGDAEIAKIRSAVRDFLERHGDSRFSDRAEANAKLIRDRAGYVEFEHGRIAYLLTSGGMDEAVNGFDRSRALEVLRSSGWLIPGSSGRYRVQRKIDGRNVSLYHIRLPDDEADAPVKEGER